MWKYIRLNLFVISKRVSTWLIPILFILVLFCTTGLIVILQKSPRITETTITNTKKMFLVLPLILMIAFVSTKVLNIFKDPEDDGTELMVASKPITRVKIIFGKFITLYILIALLSVFTFICSLLIAQADEYASTKEVITFSLSMAFGTWIVSMLLSAIIIFFSSVMGKIGTIVCSIMVPLIFALTSTTILSMVRLSLGDRRFQNDTYVTENNKIVLKQEAPSFYPDSNNASSTSGHSNDYDLTPEQVYTKHANHWYQYAAYADIWTQLTTFYSMFNKNEPSLQNSSWKYRVSGDVPASSFVDPEFLVKVKRHTYYKEAKTKRMQIFVDKDNNNKIVEATIPYMLSTKDKYGYDEKGKTEKAKQEALTTAKKAYDNFDIATKMKLKDLFEDWASKYTTTSDSRSWDDSRDKLESDIFKTAPSFFQGEWINVISQNRKDAPFNAYAVKDILMSYLVLKMLKENTSVGLNLETKSVLFSDNKLTTRLIPVGVKLNNDQKREIENKNSGANAYDIIIFGSKTPFKEPTVKKLVPSKYVPDLLVYLAWPAITILLSALIILKYMRRDFK